MPKPFNKMPANTAPKHQQRGTTFSEEAQKENIIKHDNYKSLDASFARNTHSTVSVSTKLSTEKKENFSRDVLSDHTLKHPSTTSKESKFPTKLYRILSNPQSEGIITWRPHGKSWTIIDEKALSEKIIPLYFNRCKYASFMRQLNRWGFKRITTGMDQNYYYHELFLREMPNLVERMRRLKTNGSRKTHVKEDKAPPNFYRVPLPKLSSIKKNLKSSDFSSNKDDDDVLRRSKSTNNDQIVVTEKLPFCHNLGIDKHEDISCCHTTFRTDLGHLQNSPHPDTNGKDEICLISKCAQKNMEKPTIDNTEPELLEEYLKNDDHGSAKHDMTTGDEKTDANHNFSFRPVEENKKGVTQGCAKPQLFNECLNGSSGLLDLKNTTISQSAAASRSLSNLDHLAIEQHNRLSQYMSDIGLESLHHDFLNVTNIPSQMNIMRVPMQDQYAATHQTAHSMSIQSLLDADAFGVVNTMSVLNPPAGHHVLWVPYEP